jgi:hypothetical protein
VAMLHYDVLPETQRIQFLDSFSIAPEQMGVGLRAVSEGPSVTFHSPDRSQ